MDAGLVLGTLGFVAGVCALVGFIVLFVVICCLWKRTKRDLATFKHCVEKDIPTPVATETNHPNMNEVQPPQHLSSSPVLPKCNVTDASICYSSVNILSLLPDEVRTPENLEGNIIPSEKESQLLDRYAKDKAEYEDRQLKKCEEMKASRGAGHPKPSPRALPKFSASLPVPMPSAVKPSNFEGVLEDRTCALYDSVELPSQISSKDNYQKADMVAHKDPADALLLPAQHPVLHQPDMGVYGLPADALSIPMKQPGTKKIPERPKNKVIVEASSGGQVYSDVFNSLQVREAEIVEPVRPPTLVLSNSCPTDNYENNANAILRSLKEERIVKRQDSRRASYNRRSTKEDVELDPDKQRMFRMTSKKKKSERRGGGEQVNGGGLSKNLDSPSQSLEGERMELEESTGEASVVQDREVMGVSYAMINMADRRKNRVETEAIKCEGSGIPHHFVVPVLS